MVGGYIDNTNLTDSGEYYDIRAEKWVKQNNQNYSQLKKNQQNSFRNRIYHKNFHKTESEFYWIFQ